MGSSYHFLRETQGRSLADFDIMARTLMLDPFLDRQAEGGRIGFIPLTRDLLSFFDPENAIDKLQTEAGREFFKLYDANLWINEACSPYGKIDPASILAGKQS